MAKKKTSASRSGGVNIGGGKVTVGGDIVGRDKVTTTTGLTGAEVAKIFDSVYKKIEQLPASVDKAEVREVVDAIKAEAAREATQGEPANEMMVKFSAQSLLKMAPDILEVIAASLASPAAGVAAVIRKVIDRAKAQATG